MPYNFIETRPQVEVSYQGTTAYSIYKTDILEAPKGYEFTQEFRPPKAYEIWLDADKDRREKAFVGPDINFKDPKDSRFILRKLPEEKKLEKKSSFVFKYIRTGIPKINEWYHNGFGTYYYSNGLVEGAYDIYERIEL